MERGINLTDILQLFLGQLIGTKEREMFKFIAKPVEVEAWQYFKTVGTETACIPSWAIQLAINKVLRPSNSTSGDVLSTPEGVIELNSGDWIVQDNFKYYVFPDEEFVKRYQPKV